MRFSIVRSWSRIAPLWLTCGALFAQSPIAPPKAGPPKIEPGLEEAVHWKWSVAPAATSAWGLPLPEELAPKSTVPGAGGATSTPSASEPRPTTYEVKKGDALVKIARRFFMTAEQLKQFNGLRDDRIVIGQVLKIPTPAEMLEMAPPPPPPPPKVEEKPKPKPKSKRNPARYQDEDRDGNPTGPVDVEPMTYEQLVLETVLIQVFLDREMFSPGAIDGKSGPTFQKVSQIYQETHPDAANPALLKAKALATVKQPYTSYVLRADDFKFIQPRKAGAIVGADGKPLPVVKKAPAKKGSNTTAKTVPVVPPLTYEQMAAADFLGYATVWEFVAERFHCDEGFLRELNSKLKDVPEVGTIFQVPNVVPFEIEKALDAPLQPAADPQTPVTAAVVNLARLEISRGAQLIAVLPIASARPGLTGRGSWTILNAIPQPRLTTTREPREAPKVPPAAAPPPGVIPADAPLTAPAQFLAPGPNNPIGIMWIHLAKANSTEPLAYGLHGTGIPARMRSQEGIGGFRLANWDIARAVRLLPTGTALQWKIAP
ncbi:LysM peptidoglycan-binding domain-containing protein [Luteolibacter arcticus]|uniref:LysM peptidoglycan-binding domain-containing protein n=1 Tax=Luteolibacter arcticus TaxID=1581411 RepID=A0ABT3GJJ8_9BACT|nr:LysM peptidoglycan-binding domain-containing protein [Luteolibacter arcticus]MCW1923677.1 LysM peptidoglycan-binding domain-containing protein [Luteolibacter arcticus]